MNEAFSSSNFVKPLQAFSSPTALAKNINKKNVFLDDAIMAYDSLKNNVKEIFSDKNLKFVEKIIGRELVELPIGLKGHTNDNFAAELAIVSANITPQYIELKAFARIETQINGLSLYFAADNLKLSHEGGVIGSWKLYLLGNETMPQLGSKMMLSIIGGDIEKSSGDIKSDSFIEFDCDGFKSFSFKADIRLSRSIVVPVNGEGKRIEYANDINTDKEKAIGNSNYVGTELKVNGSGWNDLLFQVNISDFEVTKLKGWIFKVKDIVIDLSDTNNSETITFPQSYTTKGLFPNNDEKIWRGFYAKEISVTLPKQFDDKKGNKRTKIEAVDLIIDNYGVSGAFAGYNVLSSGSASGWQFALSYIGVRLELGSIKKAQILGYIKPSATDSFLEVEGSFNENNYMLKASVTNSNMNMFKGKLEFEKNSWVKLELLNGGDEFRASALLNGKLSLKGKVSDQIKPEATTTPTNTSTTSPNESELNVADTDESEVLSNLNTKLSNISTGIANVGTNVVNTFVSGNTADSASKEISKFLSSLVDKGMEKIKEYVCKQSDSYYSQLLDQRKKKENKEEGKKKDDFYDFKGIVFQNLALKSHEMPYIKADYFGYPSTVSFGKFPLSFENIRLVTPSDDEVGIAFKMKIDLMEKAGISADGGFQIIGKFQNDTFQSYKFHKVVMDEFRIDIEKSGFKLKGGLQIFENDDVYGKGFKGDLQVSFPSLDISGGAKALFCTKDFSFWYVDFYIESKADSKFAIQKIEGGLSYKMKRSEGMSWNQAKSAYVPSIDKGMSYRAGVKAKFGSTTSFAAKVFLEMDYNANGGLDRIYFLGEGAMMMGDKDGGEVGTSTLKETAAKYDHQIEDPGLKETYDEFLKQGKLVDLAKRIHPVSEVAKDGAVGLFVSIEKDFKNNSFDGLFEVYCKLEGFRGAGENNLLGMVHMYSSPTKSFLHVGTPTKRLSANFMLGIYDVGMVLIS